MPTEITSPLHFTTLLKSHTHLIVDFYATWCPPCKMIAPIYEKLSQTHGSAEGAAGKFAFVKVNVDEQPEIAGQYGVQAMPTFLLFKDGKKVEEMKGANPQQLKKIVEAAAKDGGDKPVQGKKVEEKEGEKEKKSGGEELSMAERLGIKLG